MDQIRAYEPTWRERAASGLQNVLMSRFGMSAYDAMKTAQKFTGGGQGAVAGMGLLDFTPVGLAFGAQEGGLQAGEGAARAATGDVANGLLSMGAGALAISPVGKPAKRTAAELRQAARDLKQQGFTDSSGVRHVVVQPRPDTDPRLFETVFADSGRVSPVYRSDRPALQALTDQVTALQNKAAGKEEIERFAASLRPPAAQPDWAAALTRPPATTGADYADWWTKALDQKSTGAMQAFADAMAEPALQFGRGARSANAADVAAYYSQRVPMQAEQRGSTLRFSTPTGSLDILNADTNPVIRSSQANSAGTKDGGGKALYQAAYDWLATNNKVAGPDVGLSDINQLRKTGNVLSAQVRSGVPVAEMNTNRLTGIQGVPQLWQAEAKEAAARVPAINQLKFDGKQFTIGGKPADNAKIETLISSADPRFEKGVGLMTAKRNALARWLDDASPKEAAAVAAKWGAVGGGLLASGPLFASED